MTAQPSDRPTPNRAQRRRQQVALRRARKIAETASLKAVVEPTHENVTAAMALQSTVRLMESLAVPRVNGLSTTGLDSLQERFDG